MHATTLSANPFGLLTDPQSIVEAMERSTNLESLNRRICRPLDRPAPGKPEEGSSDPVLRSAPRRDDFDAWIG